MSHNNVATEWCFCQKLTDIETKLYMTNVGGHDVHVHRGHEYTHSCTYTLFACTYYVAFDLGHLRWRSPASLLISLTFGGGHQPRFWYRPPWWRSPASLLSRSPWWRSLTSLLISVTFDGGHQPRSWSRPPWWRSPTSLLILVTIGGGHTNLAFDIGHLGGSHQPRF